MKRDMFGLMLYAGFWFLFLFGLFVSDAWIAGPAAFMILLDHVGPRK